MDDLKAKQQVVEKIKSATNVLIAVSKDPSVDALSAALGLALLIDKLDKHATAVFSGKTPPAITFLEPEKTFEHTTDSLRDFIVALDKDKADHLRLKVEGDVAKIYITPYRTTISPEDLSFSQGDFNIELVIALGVDDQEHLDRALESHGQILHDAAVVTVTSGEQFSKLGGIDWHDNRASSLSEMIAGLGEALKDQDRLMDQQIATALLTGIVAATDRFSNLHTTSGSMTIAAQLMADGANQQLIAVELEKSQDITYEDTPKESKDVKLAPVTDAYADDTVEITHNGESLADLDARIRGKDDDDTAPADEPKNDKHETIEAIDKLLKNAQKEGVKDSTKDENKAEHDTEHTEADAPKEVASAYALDDETDTPAVVEKEEAPEEKAEEPIVSGSQRVIQPLHDITLSTPPPSIAAELAAEVSNVVAPEVAVEPAPTPVAATPADLGLPLPPPIPDFSNEQPISSAYALDPEPAAPTPTPETPVATPQAPQPERLGDILDEPTQPTQPESAAPAPTPTTPTPAPNDPGQFKIPGQ